MNLPSGTSDDFTLCHPLLIGGINHAGPVVTSIIVSLCQNLHFSIGTTMTEERDISDLANLEMDCITLSLGNY